MIVIKSKEEIDILRVPCKVTGELLNALEDYIRPGLSTYDVDKFCADWIRKAGMTPTFKGYGGFPGNVCVSVNEEIVEVVELRVEDLLLREEDELLTGVGEDRVHEHCRIIGEL